MIATENGMPLSARSIEISVVVATHGRPTSILALAAQLASQTFPCERYELVVVDDHSPVPVDAFALARLGPRHTRLLRTPRVLRQGGARDMGIRIARGRWIVVLDDDMQVHTDFLARHRALHGEREDVVALGDIRPAEAIATMPLFERWHARQLERWQQDVRSGAVRPRGVHLCTGNVSFSLAAYLRAGGFDATLLRSEDRDLGIRLERLGASFVFADGVVSVHASDHRDLNAWKTRARLYGHADLRIARRHRDVPNTHPWRFWALVHPLSRPVLGAVLRLPALGRVVSGVAFACAHALDRMGKPALALHCTAMSFAAEYFAGYREECGEWSALCAESRLAEGAEGGAVRASAWRGFAHAVRADHDSLRRYRERYHGERVSAGRLPADLVRKVGLQMLFWVRVMQALHHRRLPLLPMLVSRAIRHLYGAEIHWAARIEPGISIVHGTGLVVSHAARVEAGCILFQGVTLGENVDPETGEVGAPHLRPDVHVGPNAVLLGPIVVGARSKVAACTLLMRSVPEGSRVLPAEAEVRLAAPRRVTARPARDETPAGAAR